MEKEKRKERIKTREYERENCFKNYQKIVVQISFLLFIQMLELSLGKFQSDRK